METREKVFIKLLHNEVFVYFSDALKNMLSKVPDSILKKIEEIRLRADKPIIITGSFGELLLGINGIANDVNDSYCVLSSEILRIFEAMCENSVYAVQEELRNGFITIKGGHRIGITGRVIHEGKCIRNIKYFSGINIRLSRQVPGAADGVMNYIIKGNSVFHTIVISPPQCGKTTLIRDIARQISSGIQNNGFNGMKVGIVDERSEIAACYKGVPQNDVGIRTDILDCCPKSIGMITLLRSMSPQVIVTDELGSKEDRYAVMQVINAGVKLITSAHGSNIDEVSERPEISEIFKNKVFERIIILSNIDGPGTIEQVVDGKTMNVIFGREEVCCLK